MTDLSGQIIKGYELRECIGAGGFGAVYRAYQRAIEREVAIKIILPDYANKPDFIRRFEAEAQLVARLEHPHIIPLYDFWREPNGAYLVMRWLRGGNLREVLQTSQRDLSFVLQVLTQIAEALAIAHRSGVVHRDLKPDNILLDENGNAYLSDFGIAKDMTRNRDTGDGILGSPHYMAPEQFTNGPLSPRTDIYSLGIVLYELLTGEVPFQAQETRNVISMQFNINVPSLKLARSDLPSELDTVIRKATAKNPAERYLDTLSFVNDVNVSLGHGKAASHLLSPTPTDVATVTRTRIIPALSSGNPYKGLRPFEEGDAFDFYGRDAFVDGLLEKLSLVEGRFIAVVGPSGSGKSSVIKAALIPKLRKGALSNAESWFYVSMTPGEHPLQELEAALTKIAINSPQNLLSDIRHGKSHLVDVLQQILPDESSQPTELLLFIDQFEEVFTQVQDEAERTDFLNELQHAVTTTDSRLRVILTLRADFYDRPLLYPGFGELVREHTEVVLPLSSAELERAIIAPAERVGLVVEPELVAAIIRDVGKQPGALPLLQYALTELYNRRNDNKLVLQAYNDSGGVSGALAHRATELYQALNTEGQTAVRQLFLRLVTLGENAEDTRRRVGRAELNSLVGNRDTLEEVIETFGKHRLLAFDHEPTTRAPTVEIAHEALIREWGLLRSWLDESRDELRIQRRLAQATGEWLNSKRDASFLATGARLAQFETLQNSNSLALNAGETAYVGASLAQRQRAANRVRQVIVALSMLTFAAIVFAAFAFDRQNRADIAARNSRSRELAATSLTHIRELDLSLLLSLEALNSADTFEAKNSLLMALQSQPRLITFLHGHTDRVRSVAFSLQGILASGGDSTVRLWDATTGKPIGQPLKGHTSWVNSVAFSPDGTMIASASADTTIRLWNAENGAPIGQPLEGHTATVWSVAFSPDGMMIASAGEDGTVRVWDTITGDEIGQPLMGHKGIVYAVAFSPDGRILASAGADATVRLWDAMTGQPIGEPLVEYEQWVVALAFSPSGRFLASSGVDTNIVVWDLQRLEDITHITFSSGHSGIVRSLSYSPDGSLLASASADGTVQIWNLVEGRRFERPLTGHTDAVLGVAFSPDGLSLVSASADQRIAVWTIASSQSLVHAIEGHLDSVSGVAFSPDGSLLASISGSTAGTSNDNSVRLWNPLTGEQVAEFDGHTASVTSLAFRPDGLILATAGLDRTIRLWDVVQREAVAISLIEHQSAILTLTFDPAGSILASGDAAGTIILWDAKTWQRMGEPIQVNSDQVTSLAFSPDGQIFASGSRDGSVILWDVASRLPIGQPLSGHTDGIMSLAFSPDGQIFASGSRDGSVILWDVASHLPIGQPLRGHNGWVLSVAFSPDGQMMASSGLDNLVVLWDVATGQAIGQPLTGHLGRVNGVAFSPDGQYLASGSVDTSIMVWEVGLDLWQGRACQMANRNLTATEWERYFGGIPYHETCPTVPRVAA
jgi:WD40 repeat protein/serine/threonine protein kinase